MRVLFDTNVIIDGAVPERSYHEEALRLLSHVDRGRIGGLVAPISFATCWYVATTHHGVDPRPLFETVETTCELVSMNRAALRRALEAEEEVDFEDLYLAEAGNEAGAETILTRNEQDFAEGPLTPHRPETFLSMLQQ
jgi:predicted nucleic acid-binding protein